MSQDMKLGQWEKLPGRALGECTLGIIGVGNIGKAVAKRAGAFGMKILGNDVRDSDPDWDSLGVEMVSRDALLRDSDYVSLNCDMRPSNHHLIGREQLAMMKKGAVLINTARGPLIHEDALVAALGSGHLPMPQNAEMTSSGVMLMPCCSSQGPRGVVRVSTVKSTPKVSMTKILVNAKRKTRLSISRSSVILLNRSIIRLFLSKVLSKTFS
jgi:hypothetical protein